MDIDQIIGQAINKAVSQRITSQIEKFVKNEVVRELRRHGVDVRNSPRARNNSSISLVDGRDLRKTIGSLVMDRVKNGMVEQLRFKLKGLQARNRRDVIDTQQLTAVIAKAIRNKMGKLK